LIGQISGNITAPESRENWKSNSNDRDSWITFNHISGLVVNGGGTLNGQGASWWDKKDASDRPTVSFFMCRLYAKNIKVYKS
jgi:polygalacturonase